MAGERKVAGEHPGTQQALRRLPSVEQLLQSEAAHDLLAAYPRERVVEALRDAVGQAREAIVARLPRSVERDDGGAPEAALQTTAPEPADAVGPDALVAAARRSLDALTAPHLRRVLNASGVVVHTNLGRSLLADAAVERVVEAARHYSNLEYRLEEGIRGSRHEHVEGLLCRLTGAEAAMVVNNNAAAVLLMLTALAQGREVVVSRGQLVEIGGSFRIPDIMRLSGARLVEVGTTNKTHLFDYEQAVSDETALLFRVHTSNFKVVGFAEEVPVADLVSVGRRTGVLVADDLGSGALADLPAYEDEPSVVSSLAAGADVVSFSGDKLLGGPQAGILVGREDVIQTLKRHPLARAVRVDKMTLAALEGTLLLYLDPARARMAIPTLRFMDRDAATTSMLAAALAEELRRVCPEWVEVGIEETVAKAGGGALPLLELPSHGVALRLPVLPPERSGEQAASTPGAALSIDRLAEALRRAPLPVVGRVSQEALLFDVLTLEEEDLAPLAAGVGWALGDLHA